MATKRDFLGGALLLPSVVGLGDSAPVQSLAIA